MVTKAKTIQLKDLSTAIDSAVKASAARKLPGGTICGRIAPKSLADKVDVKALARDVTKQVAASVTGVKLTPKVIFDDDIIMGFIIRNPIER